MRRQTSECPAEVTLAVIGGRWKVPILFHLFQGGMRFSLTTSRMLAAHATASSYVSSDIGPICPGR